MAEPDDISLAGALLRHEPWMVTPPKAATSPLAQLLLQQGTALSGGVGVPQEVQDFVAMRLPGERATPLKGTALTGHQPRGDEVVFGPDGQRNYQPWAVGIGQSAIEGAVNQPQQQHLPERGFIVPGVRNPQTGDYELGVPGIVYHPVDAASRLMTEEGMYRPGDRGPRADRTVLDATDAVTFAAIGAPLGVLRRTFPGATEHQLAALSRLPKEQIARVAEEIAANPNRKAAILDGVVEIVPEGERFVQKSSNPPYWSKGWGHRWPERVAVFKAKDDADAALRAKYPGEWPSDFWPKAEREYPDLVKRYNDASDAVSLMSRSELAEYIKWLDNPTTPHFSLPDTWQVPPEALKKIGVIVDGTAQSQAIERATGVAGGREIAEQASPAKRPSSAVAPGAGEGERVVGAAIKVGGKVFSGPTHFEALRAAVPGAVERDLYEKELEQAFRAQHGKSWVDLPAADVDGFVTNAGRYVSREEAKQIADAQGYKAGLGNRILMGNELDAVDFEKWRAKQEGRPIWEGKYEPDSKSATGVLSAKTRGEPLVTPGLDMRQTARLARAKEEGFDTSRVWYHGTGVDFRAFDLDAVRRTGESDIAIALTDSPHLASGYAGAGPVEKFWDWQGLAQAGPGEVKASDGGRVIPGYIRLRNPKRITQEEWGSRGESADLIASAKRNGHDGIVFTYTAFDTPISEALVFDPANIRSVNAAFDPANKGKSFLLSAKTDESGAQASINELGRQAKRVENPIKVYHGSPHTFTKLDSSKIGTGEGARTYGKGLYFGEQQEVGRFYRDGLTADMDATIGGQPWNPADWRHQAAQVLDLHNNNRTAAADALARVHAGELQRNKLGSGSPLWRPTPPSTLDAIKQAEGYLRTGGALDKLPPYERAGGLYEVNIHADPREFLDWHAPVGGQTDVVKKAIEAWNKQAPPSEKLPLDKPLGGFSDTVSEKVDPTKFSDHLNAHGVVGIRYKDSGSRGMPKATYNYVVFPGRDDVLEIVGKDGKPLKGAERDAAVKELYARQGMPMPGDEDEKRKR